MTAAVIAFCGALAVGVPLAYWLGRVHAADAHGAAWLSGYRDGLEWANAFQPSKGIRARLAEVDRRAAEMAAKAAQPPCCNTGVKSPSPEGAQTAICQALALDPRARVRRGPARTCVCARGQGPFQRTYNKGEGTDVPLRWEVSGGLVGEDR